MGGRRVVIGAFAIVGFDPVVFGGVHRLTDIAKFLVQCVECEVCGGGERELSQALVTLSQIVDEGSIKVRLPISLSVSSLRPTHTSIPSVPFFKRRKI